ncbi:nose resistant to fluoxetine protein 6, partial [Nephila pilipes]
MEEGKLAHEVDLEGRRDESWWLDLGITLPVPNSTMNFSLILFIALVSGVLSESDPDYDEQVETVIEKWRENFRKFRKMSATAIRIAMPYFMDSVTSEEFVISPECKHSLFQWIADLRAMKPYALR